MQKITLIDDADATLYCYPNDGIVHHIVHRFIYGDAFKNLMTKGADAFIEHKCTKWLSDDRSNSALRKDDIEWGQTNWENRILEKNWKYWALIMPEKIVGQMNMRPIIDRYGSKGVEVKIFSDVKEGLEWLSQQK